MYLSKSKISRIVVLNIRHRVEAVLSLQFVISTVPLKSNGCFQGYLHRQNKNLWKGRFGTNFKFFKTESAIFSKILKICDFLLLKVFCNQCIVIKPITYAGDCSLVFLHFPLCTPVFQLEFVYKLSRKMGTREDEYDYLFKGLYLSVSTNY